MSVTYPAAAAARLASKLQAIGAETAAETAARLASKRTARTAVIDCLSWLDRIGASEDDVRAVCDVLRTMPATVARQSETVPVLFPDSDSPSPVPAVTVTEDSPSAIDETVTVTGETVTGPDRFDGNVTVSVRLRLQTGSASYGSSVGTATAVDYRKAREAAVKAARAAAVAVRSAARADMTVKGETAVRVSLVKGQPVFPVTGEQYVKLSRYVSRRAYGNAAADLSGSRSAAAHVRAGLQAAGIPVSSWVTGDATGQAVGRLIRWSVDGYPGTVTRALETAADRDSREAVILGSAARDGLRTVTETARPGKAAKERNEWMRAVFPVSGPDGLALLQGDATLTNRPTVAAARIGGTVGYVCSSSPDVFTESVLSRSRTGQLRFPDLAALFLTLTLQRGSLQDACRTRTGSVSGPARMAFKRAAARQYGELSGLSLEWADDASTAAADMTFAK